MRLTIDAMPILVSSGGISNYVSPLIEHFSKIPNQSIRSTLHFRTASRARRRSYSVFLTKRAKRYNNMKFDATNLPDRILKALWRTRCDILNHITLPKTDVYLATTDMLPLNSRIRRVAIIHDLTPALIPQFFKERRDIYLKRIEKLLNSCHAVVAVSQTTASHIASICGVQKEKIHVVYAGLPAVSPVNDLDHRILARLGAHRPFILYVGALAPNKNVEGIIRCFAGFIKKTALDWHLVLVGKNFMPKGYYEAMARDQGIFERVIFTGWLDEEKWALFRNAELLIHLSWYEGFPLPIIEAMAFGLPVLVGNRGPFPEAIQNNEQIVDPEDEQQVSEKLALFTQDPTVRFRWKAYMTERGKDFSWEKSSQKLLEVVQAVKESKGAANDPERQSIERAIQNSCNVS